MATPPLQRGVLCVHATPRLVFLYLFSFPLFPILSSYSNSVIFQRSSKESTSHNWLQYCPAPLPTTPSTFQSNLNVRSPAIAEQIEPVHMSFTNQHQRQRSCFLVKRRTRFFAHKPAVQTQCTQIEQQPTHFQQENTKKKWLHPTPKKSAASCSSSSPS